jgi:hypothetical protein
LGIILENKVLKKSNLAIIAMINVKTKKSAPRFIVLNEQNRKIPVNFDTEN